MANEFDAALAKWRDFWGGFAGTVKERKAMTAERLAWLQALAEAARSPLPPEEVLWLVDAARVGLGLAEWKRGVYHTTTCSIVDDEATCDCGAWEIEKAAAALVGKGGA